MGNTLELLWDERDLEDHPHIHGEYPLVAKAFLLVIGSPPHTWGIQVGACFNSIFKRITPTYMGNTLEQESILEIGKDHPHIHGEYR